MPRLHIWFLKLGAMSLIIHYSNILENKSWLVKCVVINYHKTSMERKEIQKWNQTEGRIGRATRRTNGTLGGRMDPR